MVHGGVPKAVLAKAWTLNHGVHRIGRYRVFRDHKMVTVTEAADSPEELRDRYDFDAVVFPVGDEHLKAFKHAARGVKAFGPAHMNPGGVGTLTASLSSFRGAFTLNVQQSHFKTRRPEDSSRSKRLDRSLATRYGGWRQRALREMINVMGKHGQTLRIPARLLVSRAKGEPPKKTQFAHDVEGVCADMRLKTRKYANGNLVIYPKPK